MSNKSQQTLTQMEFINTKSKPQTNMLHVIRTKRIKKKIQEPKMPKKILPSKPTPEPPSSIDWTKFQHIRKEAELKVKRKIEDVLPLRPRKDFFD